MITLEQARELTKRAVEEYGEDFVYNLTGIGSACQYRPLRAGAWDRNGAMVRNDDPRTRCGCLVGTAISYTGETRHLDADDSINVVAIRFPDMMTKAAELYFVYTQNPQDAGKAWGQARMNAESRLDLIRQSYPE